jgi:hypothetical protein
MKVRMLVSQAGIDFVRNVGDEIEIADGEAMRLLAAGIAEPMRRSRTVEKAVAAPATEKAVN